MDLTEKLFESERIFKGRLLGLRRDTVVLPDGRHGTREVIEHPGAVAVAALTEDGGVLMVEQYRYAVGRQLLEIPAGCLEPGEEPLACAVRELREETGACAKEWTPLGYIYPTAGCSGERPKPKNVMLDSCRIAWGNCKISPVRNWGTKFGTM